jgi:glutaredoxin
MSAIPETFRPEVLTIYGVDWCEDTTRARRHLYAADVRHRYVRLDEADDVRAELHGAGYRATPVVVTPAGHRFVEPTDEQLDEIIGLVAGAQAD